MTVMRSCAGRAKCIPLCGRTFCGILINYIAVRDNTDDLPQVSGAELKTLMTIICPKTALNLTAKKNFGCKNKAAMIDILNHYITTFGNTHATYLHDLAATLP